MIEQRRKEIRSIVNSLRANFNKKNKHFSSIKAMRLAK